jgi:hypothetical protein
MSVPVIPKKSENLDKCNVCFEDLENPIYTPCAHAYCQGCISRWIDEKKYERKIPCPVCRSDISEMAGPRDIDDYGDGGSAGQMPDSIRMAITDALAGYMRMTQPDNAPYNVGAISEFSIPLPFFASRGPPNPSNSSSNLSSSISYIPLTYGGRSNRSNLSNSSVPYIPSDESVTELLDLIRRRRNMNAARSVIDDIMEGDDMVSMLARNRNRNRQN